MTHRGQKHYGSKSFVKNKISSIKNKSNDDKEGFKGYFAVMLNILRARPLEHGSVLIRISICTIRISITKTPYYGAHSLILICNRVY